MNPPKLMNKIHQSICVAIPDNGLWKIVLGETSHAPIGPRLSKKDPLPDWPILFDTETEAKRMARRWTEYVQSQNADKIKKIIKKMEKKNPSLVPRSLQSK
jgi:hypothetical protein